MPITIIEDMDGHGFKLSWRGVPHHKETVCTDILLHSRQQVCRLTGVKLEWTLTDDNAASALALFDALWSLLYHIRVTDQYSNTALHLAACSIERAMQPYQHLVNGNTD